MEITSETEDMWFIYKATIKNQVFQEYMMFE